MINLPACTTEPNRWATTQPDDAAKIACRTCPIRGYCAREAWETPSAFGLWAGLVLPEEDGRTRVTMLTRMRNLAELLGAPVRPQVKVHRKSLLARMAQTERIA